MNHRTASIVATKMQFQLPGMSTAEEAQLENFLNNRTILSKDERKYLARYVVKGIPERLHGKVTQYYINFDSFGLSAQVDSSI